MGRWASPGGPWATLFVPPGAPWGRLGGILGYPWEFLGRFLGVPWGFLADSWLHGLPGSFFGASPGLSGGFLGASRVLPGGFLGQRLTPERQSVEGHVVTNPARSRGHAHAKYVVRRSGLHRKLHGYSGF
jgi:hypothetical protein